jgi:hypothetical protein
MSIDEVIPHIRRNGLLKGYCLKIYEFIFNNKKASYRDIQKYMMTTTCFPMDHVKDLLLWGAIKQIGVTVSLETGSTTPVYTVTGKMPSIPELVDYEDIM